MTTFVELVKAAASVGYKLQTTQTDEEYIKGLAYAIASVDQTVFDALSRDAQNWYQLMTQKIKEPFDQWPKLPGFKDTPLKHVIKNKSERAGTVQKIREVVMMDPMLGARQVHKLIEATSSPGMKFETVSVIVSETKSFIVLARDLGFWRDKSIYEGQEKLSVEEASSQFNQS